MAAASLGKNNFTKFQIVQILAPDTAAMRQIQCADHRSGVRVPGAPPSSM